MFGNILENMRIWAVPNVMQKSRCKSCSTFKLMFFIALKHRVAFERFEHSPGHLQRPQRMRKAGMRRAWVHEFGKAELLDPA
jgi:hypothetical protein